MFPLVLKINADNKDYWKNHPTFLKAQKNQDTGLDIPIVNSVLVPANCKSFTVDLGFKAEQNQGYMLIPRSSITKTPLRLANSIGIIDKSYRGKVIVKLDNISKYDFEMVSGSCYFQIVSFNGLLPHYELVNDIGITSRGEGGFGSTTKS